MRRFVTAALAAGLGACNAPPAQAPAGEEREAAQAAPAGTATAPAESPAAVTDMAATEPPFAVNAGDSLKVTKEAQCAEIDDPAATPWTMYPGVTLSYRGVQDGKAKVASISGKECLIAWDALSKS